MTPERFEIRGPAIIVLFGLGPDADDPPTPAITFACSSDEELDLLVEWPSRSTKIAAALRAIHDEWPGFLPGLADEC